VGPKAGELAYTQGSAIWSILRLQQSSGKEGPVRSDVVLTSTQQDSAPSLSPDGRFFAFQSRRWGNQEIWIASQAGDQLRQLTFMAGPLTGSPSWSNHGNKILFDSRPGGHSHIFCVPAAGGRPKQLTFGDPKISLRDGRTTTSQSTSAPTEATDGSSGAYGQQEGTHSR
jgi:Tol biopolymer transport system component